MGMALSVGANRTAETRLESGDYKKLPNAGIQKLLNLKQGLSNWHSEPSMEWHQRLKSLDNTVTVLY
jgi:hypothetical protein